MFAGGNVAEPELDRRVDGVHRNHAVDVELIVVDVGRERADGHRPDAGLILGHRVGLAIELANQRDLLRVRGAEAEGDGVVDLHLGRDERRPAAPAAATRGRRLRRSSGRVAGAGVCA